MGLFDFFGDIGDWFGDFFSFDWLSDWGPMLLSIGGAYLGYVAGGPWGAAIGYTLGSALGSALWPPSSEDPAKVRPEPQRMQIQTSMYGLPVASLYGTRRVAGNLLWTGNFTNEGENYFQSFAWGLGFLYYPGYELTLMRAWANDEELDIEEFCVFYDGTQSAPDLNFQELLEAEGKTRIPVFKNLAWVFMKDFPLGTSSNIPNFTFEVGIYYAEIQRIGLGSVAWPKSGGHVSGSPDATFYNTDNDRLYLGCWYNVVGDPIIAKVNPATDPPTLEATASLPLTTGTGGINYMTYSPHGSGQIIALEGAVGTKCFIHFYDYDLNLITTLDLSEACFPGTSQLTRNEALAAQVNQEWVHIIATRVSGGLYSNMPVIIRVSLDDYGISWNYIRDPDSSYYHTDQFGYFRLVCGYTYPTEVPGAEPGFWAYMLSLDTSDSQWYLRQVQTYAIGEFQAGTVWTKSEALGSVYGNEVTLGYCMETRRVYVVWKADSAGTKKIRWYRDAPDMLLEEEYEWTEYAGPATSYPINTFISPNNYRIFMSTDCNPLGRVMSHRGSQLTSYTPAMTFNTYESLSTAYDPVNGIIYGCKWLDTSSEQIICEIHKINVVANETLTATDVTPPTISKDMLTSELTGIGMSSTLLDTGDFNATGDWCEANDLAVSMTFNTCASILDWLSYIISHHDGYIVYYDGKISHKQLKRETSNMLLTSDYFVKEEGEPPVKISYPGNRDKFNRAQIEYTDRSDAYSAKATHVEDLSDIDTYGLKSYTERLDGFMTEARALKMANARLLKSMLPFESYQVKLGPKSFALRPGEVVTLTDSNTELSNHKARIMSIRPEADFIIECDLVREMDFYYDWHADAGDEFWREES